MIRVLTSGAGRSQRILPLQTIDGDRHELIGAEAGQIDPIVLEDRRRVALRQLEPPQQVLAGPEVGRDVRGRRDAGAVGPAKTRPIGRRGRRKRRREQTRCHEQNQGRATH